MENKNDQEFLEFLIKSLVDHPEDVKVSRTVDEMGVLLSLKVNAEDMGQIIGRSGSTARAIRNLVRIIGLKNHARVNLKIEEPEGGRRAPRAEEKPSRDDDEDDHESSLDWFNYHSELTSDFRVSR